jgi:ubiquinone biosynthesis protein UbiJ
MAYGAIRVKFGLARENVTPGEIDTVHDDLNRLQQDVDSLTARVEMIEERNKDH